jgi:hypothetical protein
LIHPTLSRQTSCAGGIQSTGHEPSSFMAT